MKVKFRKEEMEKNIEFTKKIYSMDDLEGYRCYFDKFSETSWLRERDENGSLEEIVGLMGGAEVFGCQLSIGEDLFYRYTVNVRNKEKDKLMLVNFNLTNENFCRIQYLYFEIYGRYLQDSKVS